MYILKNACKNMRRNLGRNLLIIMIMTAIVTCVVISFYINATSVMLMEQVRKVNATQVVIVLDQEKSRAANEAYMKENKYGKNEQGFTESLIIPWPSYSDNKEYASSQYVKDTNVIYQMSYESDQLDVLSIDGLESYNSQNPYPEMGERAKIYSMGSLTAYTNFDHTMNEYFYDGTRKIQEGSFPENENECIISYELAQRNALSLNDTITIRQSSILQENQEPELQLTITGIYFDGTNADKRLDSMFGETTAEREFNEPLLPGQNRRNEILTTESTILKYAKQKEADPTSIDDELMSKGIHYEYYFGLKDATQLEDFQQELYDKGLYPAYVVQVANEYTYNQVSTPVIELGKVSDLFMFSIIGFGACLLILISFLLIRLRTYEIGVLNAMGLRKFHITRMFIWESLLLTCISLCASFVIGLSVGKPITNHLIQEQMQTSLKNIDQTELKEVKIDLTVGNYCSTIGVAWLLGMFTSMSGVIYTMRFEPIKILSNRE